MTDGIYVSLIEGMTLEEFISVRKLYCEENHKKPCAECDCLVNAAGDILECVVVDLKSLFLRHFKTSSYKSDKE